MDPDCTEVEPIPVFELREKINIMQMAIRNLLAGALQKKLVVEDPIRDSLKQRMNAGGITMVVEEPERDTSNNS